MKPVAFVFAMLLLRAVSASAAVSANATIQNSDGSSPQIDISAAANAAHSMHPITLDEIVSFREVKEPHRSPDGSRVAFLVTQAFLSCDCYRTALYVVATSPGSVPAKVVEESSLSTIRWTPDGKSITYLSSKSGSQQLWRFDLDNEFAELVFTHVPGEDQTIQRLGYHPSDTTPVGVFTYEWSPDGSQIAFTSSPAIPKSELERFDKEGVLFDDDMDTFTLLTQQWVRVPTELWIYRLERKTEEKIWENQGEISSISWSPDSTRIALAYSAPPKLKDSMVYFNQDVGFVTVSTKSFEKVASGKPPRHNRSGLPTGATWLTCHG